IWRQKCLGSQARARPLHNSQENIPGIPRTGKRGWNPLRAPRRGILAFPDPTAPGAPPRT
ncbi:hypothetical protein HGM15179_020579, partial [Zosterops borbonicus]